VSAFSTEQANGDGCCRSIVTLRKEYINKYHKTELSTST